MTASPRDIILLSTPRAVLEPDVRGTAQLRRTADRLFALTVADDGRAEFGDWGPSGFVPSRRFRVDLDAAAAAKVQSDCAPRPATSDEGWSGDAEPIGLPFRAGLVSDIAHIGFDAVGEWVVLVSRDGCVQAKNLAAGSPVEVLPRAYRNGEALTRVEAVLGVNGGVVVCGKMETPYPTQTGTYPAFVVAHYDFTARGVKIYSLAMSTSNARWLSFPDLHCIVWRMRVGEPSISVGVALDLGTGAVHLPNQMQESSISARARIAWNRATSAVDLSSPTDIAVVNPGTKPPESGPYLDQVTDLLVLHNTSQSWTTLRPRTEGKPLLAGLTLVRAQLAGDVLAVQVSGPRRGSRIFLLRGPDSRILAEIPAGNVGHAMKLSPDGKRFAVQTSTRTAVVRASEPGSAFPLVDVGNAGLHSRVTIALEPHRLRLRVGRFEHTFTLNEVPFRHERGTPSGDGKPTHTPAGYGTSDLAYDRSRFPDTYRAGPWIAAFDKWGQVLLLSEKTGKVVLHVVVRRELAAAWLPDGTRWGSAALLGDGPHPNAAVRIGLALQAATGDGTRRRL